MRWHYADPPLLWLYPVTYVIHIAEELWMNQGYVHWMRLHGSPIAEEVFVLGNAVGLSLMISGTWLAAHHRHYEWIAVALACAVLLNTADHLAATFATHSYSPGLGSAFVLWMPLGLLTMVRAWYQASKREWWGGLATATLIHLVIVAVTRGGLFWQPKPSVGSSGHSVVEEVIGTRFRQHLPQIEMVRRLAIEQFADMHEQAGEVLQRIAEIEVELGVRVGEVRRGHGDDHLHRGPPFRTEAGQVLEPRPDLGRFRDLVQ